MGEDDEAMRQLQDWYLSYIGQIPRPYLVPELTSRIANETNKDLLHELRTYLRSEYRREGNIIAATEMILEDMSNSPTDPLPVLILAEQVHHSENRTHDALLLAQKAVHLADNAYAYRRHSRAVLARIAADLGDLALFEKCLIEIIALRLRKDEHDVGKEIDLVRKGQRIGARPDVIEAYIDYLR